MLKKPIVINMEPLSPNVIVENFGNICRLCLSTGELQSLFNNPFGEFVKILQNLTQIKVESDDELPNNICNNCQTQLNNINSFMERCIYSNNILKEVVSNSKMATSNLVPMPKLVPKCEPKSDPESSIEDNTDDETNEVITFKRKVKTKMIKECKNCGENIVNLYRHYKMKKECRPKFSCTICDKSYLRKCSLVSHIFYHTKESPYECKKCSSKFRFMGNLKRHELVHAGIKRYKCSYCGKAFTRTVSKIEHEAIHTGKNPFTCEHCGVSFRTYNAYYSHRKSELICGICKNVYSSKAALNTHSRLHTGEKPFLCTDCGKKFTSRSGLSMHSRVHTGNKPYKCPNCDKCFTQKSSMNVHKLLHTGEKRYICEFCSKRFTQSQHLKYHLRIHTGEKPFQCDLCDKSFTVKWTLTAHRRIHTGERPYVCEICDRAFYESGTLRKHIKKEHKKL